VITAPLIVLGQILGFAFAAGLNLYATIALVGLATRFGWIAGLPPAVQGVQNIIVLSTATALYLVEFLVDKFPYADTLWDIVHTVIRPVATTLIVFTALGEASFPVQLGIALLAGAVALGAHGVKAGLRLILNIKPKKALNALVSVLEDVCAVALAVLVLMYPVLALAVASMAVPLMFLFGPRLWRAGLLALFALEARLHGFFGRAEWRDTDALPRRLRSIVVPPALGRGKPRVTRAAIRGLKGVGSYRHGWVVLSDGQPVFVYASMLRARRFVLPLIEDGKVGHGVWTDTVEFTNSNCNCTIFLLKDGPSAEIALAEIRATTA
jgi:hypothetical protein